MRPDIPYLLGVSDCAHQTVRQLRAGPSRQTHESRGRHAFRAHAQATSPDTLP
jgi:hypothetical protein